MIDRLIRASSTQGVDAARCGLEPLESRVLLSVTPGWSEPAMTGASAAWALTPSIGEPLSVSDAFVTIDATLASQIVAALEAGQDVTVEATAGSVRVASPIVVNAGRATLSLRAVTALDIDAVIRGQGTSELSLDLGQAGWPATTIAADLSISGDLTGDVGTFAVAAGRTVDVAGKVDLIASGGPTAAFDVAGELIAGQLLSLFTFDRAVIRGVVRSTQVRPIDADAGVDPSDPRATVQILAGESSRIQVSGIVEAAAGTAYLSAGTVRIADGGSVLSSRGHVVFFVEDLQSDVGSLAAADRGDVVLLGNGFGSIVAGVVRAAGNDLSDVRINTGELGTLKIASTGLIQTEGGNIEIQTRALEVAGRLLTGGGAIIVRDAANLSVEPAGRVIAGGELRIESTDTVRFAGAVTGRRLVVNSPLLRLTGRSLFHATALDATFSGHLVGANGSVVIRSAGAIGLGGDVRDVAGLKLLAGGLIEARRNPGGQPATPPATNAPMRLQTTGRMVIRSAAVLAAEQGLVLRTRGDRLKTPVPLSVLANGVVKVLASGSRLRMANIVSTAGVVVKSDTLRTGPGSAIQANRRVRLKLDPGGSIRGPRLDVATFSGGVRVQGADAGRVRPLQLDEPLDAASLSPPPSV